MKFSTRAEYGLRLMVNLAKDYAINKPKSLTLIAEEEKLPLPYLERLAARLRRGNLIVSTKGVSGGYLLQETPDKITVARILEVLEGGLFPAGCMGKTSGIECGEKNCRAKQVWFKLYGAMKETLEGMMLGSLIVTRTQEYTNKTNPSFRIPIR
ncbi:MAG: Rrf2 family transcriptional regulator [bacterium]